MFNLVLRAINENPGPNMFSRYVANHLDMYIFVSFLTRLTMLVKKNGKLVLVSFIFYTTVYSQSNL